MEREGLSIRHPSKFVLVGSGNPEEGELRPQLLDRFGLSVEVKTPGDLATRIEVVKRRDALERNPETFMTEWQRHDDGVRAEIQAGRTKLAAVTTPPDMLEKVAKLCMALGTDGLRGELTLIRAARALAAFEGANTISEANLKRVAPLGLRHRLRRNPLDEAGSTVRVERALQEMFGGGAAIGPTLVAGMPERRVV